MNVPKWIPSAVLALSFLSPAWAVEYTAGRMRDPFELQDVRVRSPQGQTPADLKLNGLTWGDSPRAVINGQVVSKGDKIGNAQVIEISKDGVKLSRGGTEFMLRREG